MSAKFGAWAANLPEEKIVRKWFPGMVANSDWEIERQHFTVRGQICRVCFQERAKNGVCGCG
jgi:hypothetical protein